MEKRQEWYRNHKSLNSSGGRTNRVAVHTESFREQRRGVGDRIHWKTFALYRRDKALEGHHEIEVVKAMGRSDLMPKGTRKKRKHSQYLLGEYLGEIEDFKRSDGMRFAANEAASASDCEGLSDGLAQVTKKEAAAATEMAHNFNTVMPAPAEVVSLPDECVTGIVHEREFDGVDMAGIQDLLSSFRTSGARLEPLEALYLKEALEARMCDLPPDILCSDSASIHIANPHRTSMAILIT